MPRHRPGSDWKPKLRRHSSGQGVVRLSGRDFYLGAWPRSSKRPPAAVVRAYERRLAEWLAAGRTVPAGEGITVAQLVRRYLTHADSTYRKNGERTSEYDLISRSVATLKRLYGDTPAREFGAAKLRAFRGELERTKQRNGESLGRRTINAYNWKAKLMFRWAAEEELFPGAGEVAHSVYAVRALRQGQTECPDYPDVREPDPGELAAVLAAAPDHLRAMLDLQRLSGMRPGEVCSLQPVDLDRSREPWEYRPAGHKTQHLGLKRHVYFGPRARAILLPLLEGKGPEDFLFRTQLGRPWSAQYYSRRVSLLVAKVGASWHAHQLRHLAATEAEKHFDLDHAASMLGDTARLALTYSHASAEKARTVAEKIG